MRTSSHFHRLSASSRRGVTLRAATAPFLVIFGAVLAVLGVTVTDNATTATPAIVCGTGLMLLGAVLPRLTGAFTFGLSGVQAQLDDVNDRLEVLLAASISPAAYENLRKLSTGQFGPFEMSAGLERELRHLNLHGFIGGGYIRDIPARGDELCNYVSITEAGQAFVEAHETHERVRRVDN